LDGHGFRGQNFEDRLVNHRGRRPPPRPKAELTAPRGRVTAPYARLFRLAWVFAGPRARVKNFSRSVKISAVRFFFAIVESDAPESTNPISH
jgi:hypothetical protein